MQLSLFVYIFKSGIGTVAFDARLGLYEDSPPKEALQFIEEVQNFFTLSHKLFFSIPSRIARQYMDTPTFKKFLRCGDAILDIGRGFVDKKMRELKEMTEKGIDPSDGTQGEFISTCIYAVQILHVYPGGVLEVYMTGGSDVFFWG